MNVSDGEFVGDTLGDSDNEGVGGPDAANATATHTPAADTKRTASNASHGLRLALPDALLYTLPVT